jgi:hypothetical protein
MESGFNTLNKELWNLLNVVKFALKFNSQPYKEDDRTWKQWYKKNTSTGSWLQQFHAVVDACTCGTCCGSHTRRTWVDYTEDCKFYWTNQEKGCKASKCALPRLMETHISTRSDDWSATLSHTHSIGAALNACATSCRIPMRGSVQGSIHVGIVVPWDGQHGITGAACHMSTNLTSDVCCDHFTCKARTWELTPFSKLYFMTWYRVGTRSAFQVIGDELLKLTTRHVKVHLLWQAWIHGNNGSAKLLVEVKDPSSCESHTAAEALPLVCWHGNVMYSFVPCKWRKKLTISIIASWKVQYACKHMCLDFFLLRICL